MEKKKIDFIILLVAYNEHLLLLFPVLTFLFLHLYFPVKNIYSISTKNKPFCQAQTSHLFCHVAQYFKINFERFLDFKTFSFHLSFMLLDQYKTKTWLTIGHVSTRYVISHVTARYTMNDVIKRSTPRYLLCMLTIV